MIARGKQSRSRRSALATVGVLMGFLVAVAMMNRPGQATGADGVDTSAVPPAPADFVSTLVPCTTTLAEEMAPDTERNTVLDREHGLLRVETTGVDGQDHIFTIDYQNDAACQSVEPLKYLIDHAIEAAVAAQAQECVSDKELYASGATTLRGQPIDRAALAQHISLWC